MARGKQPGRPTKWVKARVDQWIDIDTLGMRFEIWHKWKRRNVKLGTLIVSVGGLRWRPAKGKINRRKAWNEVAELLADH